MSVILRPADAGFTLLEVLVVLIIIALAGLVVTIAVPTSADRNRLMNAESLVESLLLQARIDARRSGQARMVTFDLDAHRVMIRDLTDWKSLPAGIALKVTSAREVGSHREPAVVFLPNGTSTGAELVLESSGSRIIRRVEWLTGRVVNGTP